VWDFGIPIPMRIPYGRVQGSGYNACTGKYCIICPGGTKKTTLFFKILIANQDMHVFQFFFYILKMYPCFGIYPYVNPNLLKFLGYHNRFLRYLQKHVDFFNSVFYSARTSFDF
jgi:hypothetical protein